MSTIQRVSVSSSEQKTPKMSSEISNAIRRQQGTSGVDYWKTHSNKSRPASSFRTAQSVVSAGTKRTPYNKQSSLNFEFPIGFLPTIDQKPSKAQRLHRGKKKDGKIDQGGLSRSVSSINFNIPPIQEKLKEKEKSASGNGLKKAAVTDLTCLQLTDTLLSSRNNPFSGYLNASSSQGKLRYMDYLEDSMRDAEVSDTTKATPEGESDARISNTTTQSLPVLTTADQDRKGDIKALEKQEGKVFIKSMAFESSSKSELSEMGDGDSTDSADSDVDYKAKHIVVVENVYTRRQRSILKQHSAFSSLTDCVEIVYDEAKVIHNSDLTGTTDASVVKMQNIFKNSNTSFITPTPDLTLTSRCITIHASPPYGRKDFGPMASCSMSALFSEGSSRFRKRSVTFNVSDEVYEYAPSEPIYC